MPRPLLLTAEINPIDIAIRQIHYDPPLSPDTLSDALLAAVKISTAGLRPDIRLSQICLNTHFTMKTSGTSSAETSAPSHSRHRGKISTACGACKQRKTRCSGTSPCDVCLSRNTQCAYDATADQRRKIANQRNVQELAEAQLDLEKHRQLLGGIVATIRAGDDQSAFDLIRLIRSNVDLSQLAAHVRNECRSNVEIQGAYDAIDFVINGEDHLPPPTQVLSVPPLSAVPGSFANVANPNATTLSPYGDGMSLYGLEEGQPTGP